MARKLQTPGELVVERFKKAGIGTRELGRLVGRDHSNISRMKGSIPGDLQPILLDVAKQCDVALSAEELIRGGRA